MKKRFSLSAALLALGMVGAAGPAAAQSMIPADWASPSRFYLQGSIGGARTNQDCAGIASCDHNSFAWKALGGWRFNPNISAELGYMDLGKSKTAFFVPGGVVETNVRTDGVTLGLAGTWPIGPQLAGVLRGGLFTAHTRADVSPVGVGTESSNEPYAGIGVDYYLNRNVALEAAGDWTRARFNDRSANAWIWTVGVKYSF